MDANVTLVIPWMRTFPDRVALEILSTELGEVNTNLYACKVCVQKIVAKWLITFTHCDKNGASKSALPCVFWIVFTPGVYKDWPLVSGNLHFTAP